MIFELFQIKFLVGWTENIIFFSFFQNIYLSFRHLSVCLTTHLYTVVVGSNHAEIMPPFSSGLVGPGNTGGLGPGGDMQLEIDDFYQKIIFFISRISQDNICKDCIHPWFRGQPITGWMGEL